MATVLKQRSEYLQQNLSDSQKIGLMIRILILYWCLFFWLSNSLYWISNFVGKVLNLSLLKFFAQHLHTLLYVSNIPQVREWLQVANVWFWIVSPIAFYLTYTYLKHLKLINALSLSSIKYLLLSMLIIDRNPEQ